MKCMQNQVTKSERDRNFDLENRLQKLNSNLQALSQQACFYLNDKQHQQLHFDRKSTNVKKQNSFDYQSKEIIKTVLSEVILQNSRHLGQISKSMNLLVDTIKQQWKKNQHHAKKTIKANQQCKELENLIQRKKNYIRQQSFQSQNIVINDYSSQFQARFKKINLEIPYSNEMKQILIWVGEVCRRVFSVGFTLLQRGQLSQKKVKVFCCQNILRNLLKLSQEKKLKFEDFQKIDKCLKNQLLPYFCFKYPQTQEKKNHYNFQSSLIERDTLNQNSNDLCSKSGVDFHFEEDGNYNSQIMKFLNFIISVPKNSYGFYLNQKDQQGQLGQKFRMDMQMIFSSIQLQQTILKMLDYKPKNREKMKIQQLAVVEKLTKGVQKTYKKEQNEFNNKKDRSRQSSSNKKNQILLKYQQKVKQYTSYQIGQKLAQVPLFTEYEIEEGELKLRNTALMRTVTKWCQELQKCFDVNQIINRNNQWKMKDGSEKFMNKVQTLVLNALLQRQKLIINEEMKKIIKNNYQNQVFFSQMKVYEQLLKYSQQEAIVGQFSSAIFKINQNYIIKYLNLLIHGINKAGKDFQKLLRVYNYENDVYRGSQIFLGLNQFGQQLKTIVQQKLRYAQQLILQIDYLRSQNLSLAPQLITFKIGDLLRCKCISKQSEILALYKLMEYLSLNYPNLIKIVRVKNKLNHGNKDILMNIIYRNSCVIQMQLAIKSEKSKFIQQSNKFNHYFYELKRAQFGPIMEMCSIWASNDQRAEFYNDMMKKNNQRKHIEELNQCCISQCDVKISQMLINVPFKCIACSYFYFQCNFYQKHSECKKCGYICFKCRIQYFQKKKNNKQLLKLVSQDLQINRQQQIKICKKIPLDGGRIFSINSKDKNLKTFKTIQYKNEYYLFCYFTNQNTKDLKLIQKFKKKNLNEAFQNFSSYHLLFQNYSGLEKICQLTVQQAEKKYFIPKYFEQIRKSEKKSISFIGRKLTEEFFGEKLDKQNNQGVFNFIQKLDFSENNFNSIQVLEKIFPNAQLVILNENNLQKIDENQVKNWKQILQKLYLKKCNITHLNWISLFQSLVQLDLEGNLMKQFPKLNLKNLKQLNLKNNLLKITSDSFSEMKNLTILNLSNNFFQQFPQGISLLQNLIKLQLNQNLIKQIKQMDLKNLKRLKSFGLNYNLLISLPNSVENLKNLQKLDVLKNNLQSLPLTFGNLSNIKTLELSYNQIVTLCDSLGNLQSLNILRIFKNKLRQLPQSLGNLQNLQSLWIQENQIESLPQTLGNLKNLKSLIVYKNNLSQLPESFVRLQKLQEIWIQENQIKKFPEFLRNLPFLGTIYASNNKFEQLPSFFGNLNNLFIIQICSNNIKQLPQCFGNLKKLQILKISCNKIQKLPQQFGNLDSLRIFEIYENKLQQLPSSFGNLKKLKILQIFKNRISIFPKSFQNLESIEQIDASDNRIYQISQSLGNLKKLLNFDLQNNQLKKLPDSFGSLKNITNLIVYNNNIQMLPVSLSNLTNLQKIWIHQNKIKQLPNIFQNLQNLIQLAIYKNNIRQIPQSIGNLKNLVQFIGFNNKIQRLPESFGNLKSLKILQINTNNLRQLPQSFGNLKKLQILLIHLNQIEKLPESFGNLDSLKIFQINDNKLQQLPSSFGNLKNLSKLLLHNNFLKMLPSSICNLNNLLQMCIVNNNLQYLPQNFGNLEKLQKLFIKINKLRFIPDSFLNLKFLKHLSISFEYLDNYHQSPTQQFLEILPTEFSRLRQVQQNKLQKYPKSISNFSIVCENPIKLVSLLQLQPNLKQLHYYSPYAQQSLMITLITSIFDKKSFNALYCMSDQSDGSQFEFSQLEYQENPVDQFQTLVNQ